MLYPTGEQREGTFYVVLRTYSPRFHLFVDCRLGVRNGREEMLGSWAEPLEDTSHAVNGIHRDMDGSTRTHVYNVIVTSREITDDFA